MNNTKHPEQSPEHAHHHDDEHHAGHSTSSSTSSGGALKDPVCGMTVTAQSIHRSEHMARNFLFCGLKCKAKFDANPMQYMGAPSDPSPAVPTAGPAATGTVYTCPMHPEIRQDHPGSCPKCGMTLEPLMPTLEEDDNSELRDFQHRFWWTLPLTAIVFVLAMAGHRLQWMDMAVQSWVELVISLRIVLWAGWPFFVRGWQPAVNHRPTMWTLIELGTGGMKSWPGR